MTTRAEQALPDGLSYGEFFDYYLREHREPGTRYVHFVGTLLGTALLVAAIVTGSGWLVPLGVVVGYGHAWASHLLIERNKPAAFKYPVWSYVSDYRMLWLWLTGQLPAALMRAGVQARGGLRGGRSRPLPAPHRTPPRPRRSRPPSR